MNIIIIQNLLYIDLRMWTPINQITFWNMPVMIPWLQTPVFPSSFSISPSISTITNSFNIQDRKQQHSMTDRNQDFQLEDSRNIPQSSKIQSIQVNSQRQLPYSDCLLKEILKLIISKVDLDPKSLEEEIFEKFPAVKSVGKQFFTNIICKFKKSAKTKQEIIKYCMRKAFKFVADKLKDDSNGLVENDTLKEFIKGLNQGQNQNIPFKKNSHFKTMNTQFLGKLFGSPKFVQLYKEFLKAFPQICEADNQKKIDNLAQSMFKHINSNPRDMKRFNNFKRIPWTQSILNRCQQISRDLEKYSSKCCKNCYFTD